MSQTIPAEYRDLFNNRAFASLGTVRPNGSARVTPVWCDIEDEFVILNTAKGRHQDKNIRRDGREPSEFASAAIQPRTDSSRSVAHNASLAVSGCF